MSIFRLKYQYSKLKCPFLDSINNFQTDSFNSENPKQKFELKFQVQIK